MDRPKVCRIAKLDGRDNVLMGRDFAGIFKEGHVYEVVDRFGMIVFRDLGKHANPDEVKFRANGRVLMDGIYLLTEKEYEGSEGQNG